MSEIIRLAEEHIKMSELSLRHIDEMMARANESRTKTSIAANVEAQLAQARQGRDQGAQQLADLRERPPQDASDLAKRGQGLKGLLEAVGLQLEQALGTIFPQGSR
jgi:hypothetical protein